MGGTKIERRPAGHVLAIWLAGLMCASPGPVRAEDIRVAVASNFRPVLDVIAREFEAYGSHRVIVIAGATGKHYAQIVNGAPFHIFLAADVDRPARLEAAGRIVPGSRFTYAQGRLVLWSPDQSRVDAAGEVLRSGDFAHLAMANPELAPYGRAARETLQALGLWESLQPRLVLGENIAQAHLFVHSGNAELGFVAWSQLLGTAAFGQGSFWQVPPALHTPIEQQAVLLHDGAGARAFMDFLRGSEARRHIQEFGYDTPP